jgi:hypothetical protein
MEKKKMPKLELIYTIEKRHENIKNMNQWGSLLKKNFFHCLPRIGEGWVGKTGEGIGFTDASKISLTSM